MYNIIKLIMKKEIKNNNEETSNSNSPKYIKFLLIQKNNEIETLKKEKKENLNYINSLKMQISALKISSKKNYQLEIKYKDLEDKCSDLTKEIRVLKNTILEITKKNNESKRKLENQFNNQIVNNKKYESQKVLAENKYEMEKGELLGEIINLIKENSDLSQKIEDINNNQRIINEIKISNLKKKLINNLNKAKSKVKELNIEYTDEAAKLTLLQNHQLIKQLDYQSKLYEEIKQKNIILNEKIFSLQRELEIHKNVEISLAEKNKKLKEEINNNDNRRGGNKNISEHKLTSNEITYENNFDYINTSNFLNSNNNSKRSNMTSNKLHKSMKDLEKKLRIKKNQFIELKEKNDLIENTLKRYEKKYNGLLNYFEECLKLFFIDEDLKNNKNIYLNIDSIRRGDFSSLNKEEKYSVLIILMKYLLPLINSSKINHEIDTSENTINTYTNLNDINLRFNSMKNIREKNANKIALCKKLIFNRLKNKKIYGKNNSTTNIMNNFQISGYENLPSISKIS